MRAEKPKSGLLPRKKARYRIGVARFWIGCGDPKPPTVSNLRRGLSRKSRLYRLLGDRQPAPIGAFMPFTTSCNLTYRRFPTQRGWEGEHNLAKVGVEGSNPFARAKHNGSPRHS